MTSNANDDTADTGDALRTAEANLAQWAAAFATRDPDAMAALYRDDALHYGSKPTVYAGREGVRRYFATLRPRSTNSVRFDQLAAALVGPEVLHLAAVAHFTVDDAAPIPMRLTQTWARVDGRWRVASHHASLIPPGA